MGYWTEDPLTRFENKVDKFVNDLNKNSPLSEPKADLTGLLESGFPVLGAPNGCAKRVDVTKLDPEWAEKMHGQTLERLAERGGLGPEEIKLNIDKGQWFDQSSYDKDECIALVNSIAF